jgi:phosphoglycerate dehydrogenase-like enzyme
MCGGVSRSILATHSVVKNKQITGAAIDVFDIEPLPPPRPFRILHNVLARPHIGHVSLFIWHFAFTC